MKPPCLETDCDIPAKSRGYCPKHYNYRHRKGEFNWCKVGGCENPRRGRFETCEEHRTCFEPGCPIDSVSRGLCDPHYRERLGSGEWTEFLCKEDECNQGATARGYCYKHYEIRRLTGEFSIGNCDVPECDKSAIKKNLCTPHYIRHQTYGLTPQQIHEFEILEACESCGLEPPTVVDHCHDTGRVRGYLCTRCNVMLGMALDSPNRLIAGATYLRRKEEDERTDLERVPAGSSV